MDILIATALTLIVYAEDPVFYADEPTGAHSFVEYHNIGIDAGECVIWNTFGEGDPVYYQEKLANTDELVKIGKIKLRKPDGQEVWLTLTEMDTFAKSQCVPDLLG